MDDATLVSRAVGGDRDAFAAIYDRYAGAVLDLGTAVLRDGDEAAESTLGSFLRAARELVHLRDRSRLRSWLLAVARHEATTRAERRRWEGVPTPAAGVRVGGAGVDARGGSDAVTSPGAAPDPGMGDRPLVWDPAEELSDRDRAILHLHLRHQLHGDDLGATLGLKPALAESRAARLRRRTETSVGALLLSRGDSGADPTSCRGLAAVLGGWDGRFTPAVSARVDRHAARCQVCRGKRALLLDRLAAMASLPFVDPPPWLRQEVLLRMELAVSPRLLPGWSEDGFPPGIDGAGARKPSRAGAVAGLGARSRGGRGSTGRNVLVALMAAAVGVAGGLFLITRGDDRSTLSASGSAPSTVGSSTLPGTSAPTTLGRPAVTAPVTTAAAETATTTTVAGAPGVVPISPPTTAANPAPAPSPVETPPDVVVVDRDPPSIVFGASAASAYTSGCPYATTDVSAEVTDASAVAVQLVVRDPEGGERGQDMSLDGGLWRGTIGDFPTAGRAVFWVEAVDSEGNRSRADDQVLDVLACEP